MVSDDIDSSHGRIAASAEHSPGSGRERPPSAVLGGNEFLPPVLVLVANVGRHQNHLPPNRSSLSGGRPVTSDEDTGKRRNARSWSRSLRSAYAGHGIHGG